MQSQSGEGLLRCRRRWRRLLINNFFKFDNSADCLFQYI